VAESATIRSVVLIILNLLKQVLGEGYHSWPNLRMPHPQKSARIWRESPAFQRLAAGPA
jgi:hypothetical protein